MAHEMLVGLHVTDDAAYARYRAAMTPLLATYGGGFRYDFHVAETLKSEVAHPINRVFTIHFADRGAKDRFFADPAYLRMKGDHFVGAVAHTAILAEYER